MRKKRKDEKHLNRQQLLRAARDPDCRFEHLDECLSCSQAVSLLRLFSMAGKQTLQDAPENLIRRAVAIARKSPEAKAYKRQPAEIIFDSWLKPQPVGVRGVESLDHRRVRFEASGIIIDLRAERTKVEWDLIARVSGYDTKKFTPRLSVGRKTISPDPYGFYVWKSKRPPGKILLHAGGSVIELPELSWKKPRPT